MFVVAQVGSTQYMLREKDEFLVDHLALEEGKNFVIDDVLLYSDGKGKVLVGTPYLGNVKVETRVLGEEKGDKIRVFKMKPKKRYERTRGHRSVYTRLRVLKVSVLSGSSKVTAAAKKEEAPIKKEAKPSKKTETSVKAVPKKKSAASKKAE